MTSQGPKTELAQLRADGESEQRAAIEALAQIVGTPEEIEHLRRAAVTVLRRMSPRSYTPLAALLGTLDPQARIAAHLALVSMGNDEHVP